MDHTVFAAGLVLAGLGFVFALPVNAQPLNDWLRQARKRRVGAGLFIGAILFLTLAYLGTQIGAVWHCYEVSQYGPGGYNCGPDDAIQLGFTSGEELRRAVERELFWRSITPPPFRPDCYADNPAFCDFVGSSPDWDSYTIRRVLIFYGWPLLVLWSLIWWWTRPYPTPKIGEET